MEHENDKFTNDQWRSYGAAPLEVLVFDIKMLPDFPTWSLIIMDFQHPEPDA